MVDDDVVHTVDIKGRDVQTTMVTLFREESLTY